MKKSNKLTKCLNKISFALLGLVLSTHLFAADKLAGVLSGDVQDTFGSSGNFWKIYIIVDIVLAGAAALKTKNPLVFGGVFFIALIPGFLVQAFVFG